MALHTAYIDLDPRTFRDLIQVPPGRQAVISNLFLAAWDNDPTTASARLQAKIVSSEEGRKDRIVLNARLAVPSLATHSSSGPNAFLSGLCIDEGDTLQVSGHGTVTVTYDVQRKPTIGRSAADDRSTITELLEKIDTRLRRR